MESSPSSIFNIDVRKTLVVDPLTTTLDTCAFEILSRFILLGEVDEAGIEPSNS